MSFGFVHSNSIFLPLADLLPNSLTMSNIRPSIVNLSLFRFSELLSIFETSKISSASFFNFFVFLITMPSNSLCSLSFVLLLTYSVSPSIG